MTRTTTHDTTMSTDMITGTITARPPETGHHAFRRGPGSRLPTRVQHPSVTRPGTGTVNPYHPGPKAGQSF